MFVSGAPEMKVFVTYAECSRYIKEFIIPSIEKVIDINTYVVKVPWWKLGWFRKPKINYTMMPDTKTLNDLNDILNSIRVAVLTKYIWIESLVLITRLLFYK